MTRTIQFSLFAKYPQICHAISTKAFGTMKKENNEVHHANLLKFVKSFSKKSIGISMNQIHGGNVQVVENSRLLVIEETDAIITNKRNLALTVLVADCVPVLVFDTEKNAIAVIHAGSKGLVFHVIENTISAMKTAFDSNPKDLIVGIGPSICNNCYEVNESFADQYISAFPECTDCVTVKNKKYTINLPKLTTQLLQKQGILRNNIELADYCTRCDDALFYSYRHGNRTERIAGSIALE